MGIMEIITPGMIDEEVVKNQMKNITDTIVDRSARPAYIPFREAWKHHHPEAKMLQIYFTNPQGYDELMAMKETAERFANTYPLLVQNKKAPILVYDNCIHSGSTAEPILTALDQIGFKDVSFGVAYNDTMSWEEAMPCMIDFTASESKPLGGCYFFGRDQSIEKMWESLISLKSIDEEDIEITMIRRKELLEMSKEIYEKGIDQEILKASDM